MHKQQELSVIEIETLVKAYLDCKLSRPQEKELELVLLHSPHNTPLIDDCRRLMGLQVLLVSTPKLESISAKKSTKSIWRKKSYIR